MSTENKKSSLNYAYAIYKYNEYISIEELIDYEFSLDKMPSAHYDYKDGTGGGCNIPIKMKAKDGSKKIIKFKIVGNYKNLFNVYNPENEKKYKPSTQIEIPIDEIINESSLVKFGEKIDSLINDLKNSKKETKKIIGNIKSMDLKKRSSYEYNHLCNWFNLLHVELNGDRKKFKEINDKPTDEYDIPKSYKIPFGFRTFYFGEKGSEKTQKVILSIFETSRVNEIKELEKNIIAGVKNKLPKQQVDKLKAERLASLKIHKDQINSFVKYSFEEIGTLITRGTKYDEIGGSIESVKVSTFGKNLHFKVIITVDYIIGSLADGEEIKFDDDLICDEEGNEININDIELDQEKKELKEDEEN